MTTPLDIISLALKTAGVLGVGQVARAEDTNDAFLQLNWMLAQWQRKRWLVYTLETLSVASTGAQTYTIGPGGDIDTPTRPDRLEDAFFRQTIQSQPNQVDYPLELIEARETYNQIALKQLQTFPSYIYYSPDYPLGTLYPWPVPQANIYSIFVSVKQILAQFSSLEENIILPEEYFAALYFNLALRLCVAYQLQVSPTLVGLAKEALNVIRNADAQIARLQMPSDLVRPGIYNPYSDQIR